MVASFSDVSLEDILFLRSKGFKFVDTRSPYEEQRLSNGKVSVILYTSGKLVLQGKRELVDLVSEILVGKGLVINNKKKSGTENIIENNWNSIVHIGSDETLKGDTFGGIVIVAFLYFPAMKTNFEKLGIRDSKKIIDSRIKVISQRLEEDFKEHFVVRNIFPKEYNQFINKFGSVTVLLNNFHSELGSILIDRFKKNNHKNFDKENLDKSGKILFVVDKFPGCKVGDFQISHGESHSDAIAAASIIARSVALEQIELLSQRAGFKIPLGSSDVLDSLNKLALKKLPFEEFVKMHFKNVKSFLK